MKILLFLLFLLPLSSWAGDYSSKGPCKKVSLDVTLRSYHFERGNQNEDNFGLSGECQVDRDGDWILETGWYRNSGRHTTKHFGILYDPWKFGDLRLGGMVGYASGYVDQRVCEKYYGFSLEGECYVVVGLATARYQLTEHYGVNLWFTPAAGGVLGLQARYDF